MVLDSLILLQDVCRLCHKNPGVENIFSSDLSADIQHFLSVQTNPNENLPKLICEKCKEIIVNVKELNIIAQKNDLCMRAFINDSGDLEPIYIRVRKDLFSTQPNSKQELLNSMSETVETTNESQCDNVEAEKKTARSLSDGDDDEKPQISPSKKIKTEVVFECGHCNKEFPTKKKLSVHQRQHTRMIKCPIDACAKAFATKGDLQKHIRHHTGEKPYQCDLCEKRFSQNSTLKYHRERIHIGV